MIFGEGEALVGRPFGTTPHSEIAKAFEAERREHTFVEQLSSGEYAKRYQLRLNLEELLTLLDGLGYSGAVLELLASRQLRAKILATLGLFEEG